MEKYFNISVIAHDFFLQMEPVESDTVVVHNCSKWNRKRPRHVLL